MSRSSIFSSETLKGPFHVPKGAALALVILLVVEFGVARQNLIWDMVTPTPAAIVPALNEQVVKERSAPRIVILGSSRMRDAVDCSVLEDALGLVRGSAINMSMDGGNPFDADLIYTMNREKFKEADVVIVGLEDWYYNGGYPVGERARRFMTLEDRIGIFNPEQTRSLVAGWLWKTYDARGPLSRIPKAVHKGADKKLPWNEKEGRINWRKRILDTGPSDASADIRHWSSFMYQRYQFTRGYESYLNRLTEKARKDDARVVHVQVPSRRAHVAWTMAQWGPQYAAYKEAVLELDCDLRLFHEAGDELKIPDHHYYDYGHLATRGSHTFTRYLAEKIRPLLAR